MDAAKAKQMAQEILEGVGGSSNVIDSTHCITRLRLTLADDTIPDDDRINRVDGVSKVVRSGGQYQVVIGPAVEDVYNAFVPLCGEGGSEKSGKDQKDKGTGLAYYGGQVLGYISGSIVPSIPVLVAGGVIMGIVSLLGLSGVMDSTSPTYTVLYNIGYAGIYFLPVFVGYGAASRLQLNPALGAMLGAILVSPNLMGVEGLSLFGIELPVISYAASILPILMAVPVLKVAMTFFERLLPDALRLGIATPLSVIITAPIMLLFLAPLGNWIGVAVSDVFMAIYNVAPVLGCVIVGGTWPLLIITGTHQVLGAVGLQLLTISGADPLFSPGITCATLAVPGALFGIFLRARNKELKADALTAMVINLTAAMEPGLFGILIPLRRPLVAGCLASAIGTAVGAFLGMTAYGYNAGGGLLTLPVYFTDDIMSFISAVVAVAVSFVAGVILSYVMGFDESRIVDAA